MGLAHEADPGWPRGEGAGVSATTRVRLSGRLVCASEKEDRLIRELLPAHIEATRAERGCLSFEVRPADEPLEWLVDEEFDSVEAFEAHQERMRGSQWGRRTAGITRRYSIDWGDAPH